MILETWTGPRPSYALAPATMSAEQACQLRLAGRKASDVSVAADALVAPARPSPVMPRPAVAATTTSFFTRPLSGRAPTGPAVSEQGEIVVPDNPRHKARCKKFAKM